MVSSALLLANVVKAIVAVKLEHVPPDTPISQVRPLHIRARRLVRGIIVNTGRAIRETRKLKAEGEAMLARSVPIEQQSLDKSIDQ